MSAALSASSGWLALALIPIVAGAGWILRRFVGGSFRLRMRPHYILGYATFGFALVHLSLSMRATAGADPNGLWLATLALLGLGWQALIGSNLQSPGDYRPLLRRWHLVTFVAVMIFAAGHVMLNR
jgi:hypothetical protein